MTCNTCGDRRTITIAEGTCQSEHQAPCPVCVGTTIAIVTMPVEGLTSGEGLRALSDRATPGPWAWEQCGDKEDAPVVGTIYGLDGDPITGEFKEPIDADEFDYSRDSIFRDVQSSDGCSASANAAFAVACVNYVRAMLAASPKATATASVREAVEAHARWLDEISTNTDMAEIVADSGITAGMVIQQEAREQRRRLLRALTDSGTADTHAGSGEVAPDVSDPRPDRNCDFCGPGWKGAHKYRCPRAHEDNGEGGPVDD